MIIIGTTGSRGLGASSSTIGGSLDALYRTCLINTKEG